MRRRCGAGDQKGRPDESDQPCNLRLSTWFVALGNQRDQLPP
jgi:hypothetical protein